MVEFKLSWSAALRLFIFLSLPFVSAKSAFSIEDCVKESLKFADCVDSTIVSGATTTEQVEKDCAAEKKAYESCGQFEKAAFSADFIRVRVELFGKQRSHALASGSSGLDPATRRQ